MNKISELIPSAESRLSGPMFPPPKSLNQLLTEPIEPISWLVQDLIPSGSLIVFSGKSGDFKTWVEMHWAASIASNDLVFGHFATTQGGVMIVDEENSDFLLKSRFVKMGVNPELPINVWIRKGFKIENPRHRKQLKDFVVKQDIKLVCFDSLVRIHTKDENSAVDMAKVFDYFKSFLEIKVSVLIIHHHRKEGAFQNKSASQSLRGSSDILAAVDCHLMIDRNREESKFKIIQNKLRLQEELKPFEVNVIKHDDETVEFKYIGELSDLESKKEVAKTLILQAVENGEVTQSELKELLQGKVGGNAISLALKQLVTDSFLIEKTGARNRKSYELPGEQNQLFS